VLFVGRQFQLPGQHQRITGDAVGVPPRVAIAQLDRLGQGRHRVDRLVELPLHQLRAFDADRDVGGNGVGQTEIFLIERLLQGPTV